MTVREVLSHLSGYYFIRSKSKYDKCICTNHKDYYLDDWHYPKATEEILNYYGDYEVCKISSSYDGWSTPWIDLYIKEEN